MMGNVYGMEEPPAPVEEEVEKEEEVQPRFEWLCQVGHFEEIEKSLQSQSDKVLEKGILGRIPLHWACERGSLETVQLLLRDQREIQILRTDNHNRLPIHFAVKGNSTAILQELLQDHTKEQILHQDEWMSLPVHRAASLPVKREVMELLLSFCRWKQLITPDSGGKIPLHHCCIQGSLELIDLLLRHFPQQQVHVADKEGKLPIHYACMFGGSAQVDRLLQFSPREQATVQDFPGNYPLAYALPPAPYQPEESYHSERIEIFKALIEQEADVQIRQKRVVETLTPLIRYQPAWFEAMVLIFQHGLLLEEHMILVVGEYHLREKLRQAISQRQKLKSARSAV